MNLYLFQCFRSLSKIHFICSFNAESKRGLLTELKEWTKIEGNGEKKLLLLQFHLVLYFFWGLQKLRAI